jgi:ABC-type transport system substrate-binding protein
VEDFNPVYRAVYRRNPDYREVRVPDPKGDPNQRWDGWEEDLAAGLLDRAGDRLPLIDGIELRFILEDQPRWLYFKNGHLDFLNPPKDNIAEAIPMGRVSDEFQARGVTTEEMVELGTVYTCLNTADPVMSNVNLRRAMALAFDHKWTVDNLYGGEAIVATSPIPPGVAGYDPDHHPHHRSDGVAQLDEARKMMAVAGYPEGRDPKTGKRLRVRFESSGSGVTQRQFAQRYVDEMRKIDINVDIVVNTFPQMIDKMRKKQFQVAGLAWGFDYPDAQNILQLLYGPNAAPGVGSANHKNPAFDKLYAKASTMEDSPERTELYQQMAHIIGDDVPWITRAHRIRHILKQPWLHGFKYTEVTYRYWNWVWLDTELRDREVAAWNKPTLWPVGLFFGLVFGIVGASIRRLR